MTKVPSYLKGLVESRAHSAGDIVRLEQLRALIDEQLAAALKRRESADNLIREFNPLLDPTAIQPVRARRGRYGPHGSFKKTVYAVLDEAGGESLPSAEIGFRVALRLDVKFASIEQHREWSHNCVNKELLRQSRRGDVERIRGENRGCVTHWRVKRETPKVTTLDGLKALTVQPVSVAGVSGLAETASRR